MNKNLSLASALALCGTIALASSPAAAGDGMDALNLLPDDTMLVMSVDVTRMGKSKLAKDLFGLAVKSSEFGQTQERLLTEAKLDVSRDVDNVIIGVSGDIDKADEVVFMAKGRFDQKEVVSFLKKDAKSFAARSHRGVDYHVIDGDTEVAFIGTYFVATPKGGMPKIIDVHRGKAAPLAKNTRFKSLLGGGHVKRGMWFALALTPEMRKEIASEASGHSVDAMVAGVDIGTDVKVSMLMRASDKTAATGISTMIGEAAKEAAKEPSFQLLGLTDAFNKMKVQSSGTDVTVEMTVPGASLQQILPVLKGSI